MGAYKGTQNIALQGGANSHVMATDSKVDYVTGDISLNGSLKSVHDSIVTINSTNVDKNVTDMASSAVDKGIGLAGSVVDTLSAITDKVLNINGDLTNTAFEQIEESHEESLDVISSAMGKMTGVYNETQERLINNSETRQIDVNGAIKSAMILGGTLTALFALKGVFK